MNPVSAPSSLSPPEVDSRIREAAEGMEAIFLDLMLRSMRETIPKNEMDLESPATSLYRGLLDQEYAQKISHGTGVGLAQQIIDYLTQAQSTRGVTAPPITTP